MREYKINEYNVGDINLNGIEPIEEFKEYVKKEKHGTLTEGDSTRFLNKPYKTNPSEDIPDNLKKILDKGLSDVMVGREIPIDEAFKLIDKIHQNNIRQDKILDQKS